MKFRALVASATMILFLVSCKKTDPIEENTKEEELPPVASRIKDSCSYVIDGKRYTCDGSSGFGRGIAGIPDTLTGGWLTDSMHYFNAYELDKYSYGNASDDGYIKISFIKNYGKNQLTKLWPIGIKGPASELELYALGSHPYAVDHERFNRQNGIAIQVRTSSAGTLRSYTDTYWKWPTTIAPDCQKDSKFEVTKFSKLPTGEHLLEAVFSATVFDRYENPYQLDSGYVRTYVYTQ